MVFLRLIEIDRGPKPTLGAISGIEIYGMAYCNWFHCNLMFAALMIGVERAKRVGYARRCDTSSSYRFNMKWKAEGDPRGGVNDSRLLQITYWTILIPQDE
jgi:hypothetical protein